MIRNWSLVSFGKSFFTPAGRQAAANFAWMLAGRIISQACLVGVILLLTRALGREQFGIFATALALQGYIVLLATAGMPAVVVREAVRRPGEVTQIASTFLAVAWTVGLFAALVLCVVVLFVNISPEEKLLLVALSLGAAIASGDPQPLFDALHRQAVPSTVLAATDILLLAGIAVLCSVGGLSLPMVGLLFASKWLFNILAMVVAVRRWVPVAPSAVNVAEAVRLWHSSWPLLVAGFLFMLPVSAGALVVRWFHGPSEAALMGLAVQVLQVSLMLATLAHRLVRPHVAGPYGFHRGFVVKLAAFYAVYLGGLFGAAVVGCYAVIRWVLDPAYSAALWPCWIMAGAALVAGTGTALNNYLLVLHRERRITVSYVACAATFLILAVFLGPGAGALGVAWASVGAFAILLLANTTSLLLAGHGSREGKMLLDADSSDPVSVSMGRKPTA